MIRNRLLRQKVYDRDKGICIVCGLYDAKWQADHRLELWEGGKDVLDNMQTLCRRHHQDKTSAATPVRAKTDRLRERHELTASRRKVNPETPQNDPELHELHDVWRKGSPR